MKYALFDDGFDLIPFNQKIQKLVKIVDKCGSNLSCRQHCNLVLSDSCNHDEGLRDFASYLKAKSEDQLDP